MGILLQYYRDANQGKVNIKCDNVIHKLVPKAHNISHYMNIIVIFSYWHRFLSLAVSVTV